MYRVAIVGRPNVGKSTLFNRLIRKRKALVGDEPGITRDRIFHEVEWSGKRFEVVDTGGILPDQKELILDKILTQAALAVAEADLVLMVVDARAGLTPLDEEVGSFLRASDKEFLVVANKVDVEKIEPSIYQFYELGVENVFPISAEHGLGIEELLDEILGKVPETEERSRLEETRIAIIGRPNVGKSSLVNALLGEERAIVTDIPGTTRDSVDSLLDYEGHTFRLVDTAGIRRKGKTVMAAEKLSVVMARKSIEQADVVFLLLDVTTGVNKSDAVIGGYAHEAGRSLVLVANKWDKVEKVTETSRILERSYRDEIRFLDYAPMVFVSAMTGQRVNRLLGLARDAHQGGLVKVPTAELNRFLLRDLGVSGGMAKDRSRVKFACQVGVMPPTFVFFLRGSRRLHFSTVRFLSNRLREQFDFFASPIRIIPRASRRNRGD